MMRAMHDAVLPKPEVKGEGTITYRCAACTGMIEGEEAVFYDGKHAMVGAWSFEFNENVRTYHRDHIGENVNGR